MRETLVGSSRNLMLENCLPYISQNPINTKQLCHKNQKEPSISVGHFIVHTKGSIYCGPAITGRNLYPYMRLGPYWGDVGDRLSQWFFGVVFTIKQTLTALSGWLPHHTPNRKIEFWKLGCVSQRKAHPLIICDVLFVVRFQVNQFFF